MKWKNLAGYYKKNSVFACLPSNFSLRQLSKTCVGFAQKTDKLYDRTEAYLSVSKRRSWSARPSRWEFLIVRHLLVQFFSFLGTVFHQSERTYLLNIWPLETFISSRLLIKKHRLLYIVIISLTPYQIWLPKTCRNNPLLTVPHDKTSVLSKQICWIPVNIAHSNSHWQFSAKGQVMQNLPLKLVRTGPASQSRLDEYCVVWCVFKEAPNI